MQIGAKRMHFVENYKTACFKDVGNNNPLPVFFFFIIWDFTTFQGGNLLATIVLWRCFDFIYLCRATKLGQMLSPAYWVPIVRNLTDSLHTAGDGTRETPPPRLGVLRANCKEFQTLSSDAPSDHKPRGDLL